MNNFISLARKEIKNYQPYIPGEPIEKIKKKFGLKKVIKLASNEIPFVSQEILNALKKFKEINRYPEGSSVNLRETIAKKYNVCVSEVIVGSGSDEIVELLGKAFLRHEDEIIVSEHAFIRYKMVGDLMGCKVREIPMKNYTHNLEQMANITKNTKIIFIANPNNPTGTYNTKKEVDAFFKKINKFNSPPLVVFDEAYYEFARIKNDYPDTLEYFKKYKNIIILRTFSKIYGLAGLRIGYGFMNEEIVSLLDRIRLPFNITSVSQIATLTALKNDKFIKKTSTYIQNEKKFLEDNFKKLNIKFVPSAANFYMIDVSPLKGKDVFQKLLRCGIIVRPLDEYGFPECIRVSVGLHSENVYFLEKFIQILDM